MLHSETRGYKGRGRFVLRRRAGGRPFELGNTVSLNEAIETNREGRADYENVAGGEKDVDEQVTQYTFEAVVNDISPRNLAMALRGTVMDVDAALVDDEVLDAWAGTRLAFRYLPDPDEAVTVAIAASTTWAAETAFVAGATIIEGSNAYRADTAGTSGAVEPTWPTDGTPISDGTVTWQDLGPIALTADTHYERIPHGIRTLPAADALFLGELPLPLDVTYTRNPQSLVQALMAAGDEYEITWLGLNPVDGGHPITARYFRVKFSPTSGLPRQGGDGFAELSLSGTVLADETRTGAGLSKHVETSMI